MWSNRETALHRGKRGSIGGTALHRGRGGSIGETALRCSARACNAGQPPNQACRQACSQRRNCPAARRYLQHLDLHTQSTPSMHQIPTHRRVAKGLDQLVHRLAVRQPLKCVWLVLGCTRGTVRQQSQLLAIMALSYCRACIELHRGRPHRNQAGLRAGPCINTLSRQALPACGRLYH